MAAYPAAEAFQILFPGEGAIVPESRSAPVKLRAYLFGSVTIRACVSDHENIGGIKLQFPDDIGEDLGFGRRRPKNKPEEVRKLAQVENGTQFLRGRA